jgi:futalosine hydrolase
VSDSVTRVLVVAATGKELAVGDGWLTLCCGVGPVEAAAITASAIARTTPHLILHVGIAGARRAAALRPPAHRHRRRIALLRPVGAGHAGAVGRAGPVHLVASARRALPDASCARLARAARSAARPVATWRPWKDSRCSGPPSWPASQRWRSAAISNAIEDADRSLWKFDEAFAAVIEATPRLVSELSRA